MTDTTDLRVAACNFRGSARSVRPHPANPHVVRASDVAHFVDMDCAVIAQRVDEAADTIASLEAALKECVAVMGETLDKDFGFWSSPAQDDRRSRFYPAWKQGHTALKGQTP